MACSDPILRSSLSFWFRRYFRLQRSSTTLLLLKRLNLVFNRSLFTHLTNVASLRFLSRLHRTLHDTNFDFFISSATSSNRRLLCLFLLPSFAYLSIGSVCSRTVSRQVSGQLSAATSVFSWYTLCIFFFDEWVFDFAFLSKGVSYQDLSPGTWCEYVGFKDAKEII